MRTLKALVESRCVSPSDCARAIALGGGWMERSRDEWLELTLAKILDGDRTLWCKGAPDRSYIDLRWDRESLVVAVDNADYLDLAPLNRLTPPTLRVTLDLLTALRLEGVVESAYGASSHDRGDAAAEAATKLQKVGSITDAERKEIILPAWQMVCEDWGMAPEDEDEDGGAADLEEFEELVLGIQKERATEEAWKAKAAMMTEEAQPRPSERRLHAFCTAALARLKNIPVYDWSIYHGGNADLLHLGFAWLSGTTEAALVAARTAWDGMDNGSGESFGREISIAGFTPAQIEGALSDTLLSSMFVWTLASLLDDIPKRKPRARPSQPSA